MASDELTNAIPDELGDDEHGDDKHVVPVIPADEPESPLVLALY